MLEIKDSMEDYTPLRDIVFQKLREAIVTGQLKPGDRLMEIRLANAMGVSRTPVREAIRKLQNEGLVIMNARRGAVELASDRADDEAIGRLREINRIMRQAVEDSDISRITEQDVEFHETITSLADNAHLTDMLDQIKEHLYRYRLEFIKELKDRSVLVEEHERIIDAISEGNAKGAGREIERHIEHQERYILNSIEKWNTQN